MTVVKAGDHGDLAKAHAALGEEGLRQHLAEEHGRTIRKARGNDAAQKLHARLHARSHLSVVPARTDG